MFAPPVPAKRKRSKEERTPPKKAMPGVEPPLDLDEEEERAPRTARFPTKYHLAVKRALEVSGRELSIEELEEAVKKELQPGRK